MKSPQNKLDKYSTNLVETSTKARTAAAATPTDPADPLRPATPEKIANTLATPSLSLHQVR